MIVDLRILSWLKCDYDSAANELMHGHNAALKMKTLMKIQEYRL